MQDWTAAVYSSVAGPFASFSLGYKHPLHGYVARASRAVHGHGYDWLHVGLASGLTVMGALLVYYKFRERQLVNTMRTKDRMVAKYIMQVRFLYALT